jgi:phosphoenolpyruvate carboxylase
VTSAQPIHFEAKDRPLRHDVGRLGALLGEILRQLAPEGVFETVERARLASRRRHSGDSAADAEIERVLVQTVRGIARALRNTG